MKRPRVSVTDHAVVRYLERVGGFDIDTLRREIARRVQAAANAGASTVTIDGAVFVIVAGDNGPTVTTVMTRDQVTQARVLHPGRNREDRA